MTKKLLFVFTPLALPILYILLHFIPLLLPLFLAYLVYLNFNQSINKRSSFIPKRKSLLVFISLLLFTFSLLFLKAESSFLDKYLQPSLSSRPYFTTRQQDRFYSSTPFSFPIYLSQNTGSVNLVKLDLTYQADSLQFLGLEENSLQNTLLLSSYHHSQDAYLSLLLSPTSSEFSSPDSLLASLRFLPLTAGQTILTILPTSKIYQSSQNIHFSRPQTFPLSLYPAPPSSDIPDSLNIPLLSLPQNNDQPPANYLPSRVYLSNLIYRLDTQILSLFWL